MANVLVDETSLEAIADTIRSKLGVSDTYLPSEMADAIDDIGGGVTPTGTKQISITANGTTTEDVTNYASAEITVNVSGGSSMKTGTYTPSSNETSHAFDTDGNYDHFVLYAETEPGGHSVRALRAVIADFSVTNYLLGFFTTNNTGSGVQAPTYYGTGTVSKSGTVVTYNNSSNNLVAGVTYRWVAW